MEKELPLWTTKDFKIKRTPCGYSVYYVHDEKSRCLRSQLRELKQVTSYIDFLINFSKDLQTASSKAELLIIRSVTETRTQHINEVNALRSQNKLK